MLHLLYQADKGKPSSLLEELSLIVPHVFGEHEKCKEWRSDEPDNDPHSDLPEGRDLTGADLRASIEDALQSFLTEEAAKHLAPVGSSQRNECLNSVIGTKAPKTRHNGGSESSDCRTAAGVAQFNNGYRYVAEAVEETGLAANFQTETYIKKMDDKKQ